MRIEQTSKYSIRIEQVVEKQFPCGWKSGVIASYECLKNAFSGSFNQSLTISLWGIS
jgi:hypothetical protein